MRAGSGFGSVSHHAAISAATDPPADPAATYRIRERRETSAASARPSSSGTLRHAAWSYSFRTRLQLVRDNPGLQEKRAYARGPLARVVKAFIAARSRLVYTEGELSCLAALIATAIDAALIEWSGSDEAEPMSHVENCLRFIVPVLGNCTTPGHPGRRFG
ncbi:hypothetical protein [Streptomyces sp. NPDC001652]|uniref:hypothetical protein n=1 Tax=Streptomyces sp. NPDC001652 TaxID=3154393 RepID=UPI00331C8086